MAYNPTVANKENFTFRFDPEFIAAVDAQGKREKRSRTNMFEVMGAEYLREKGVPETIPAPDEINSTD